MTAKIPLTREQEFIEKKANKVAALKAHAKHIEHLAALVEGEKFNASISYREAMEYAHLRASITARDYIFPELDWKEYIDLQLQELRLDDDGQPLDEEGFALSESESDYYARVEPLGGL